MKDRQSKGHCKSIFKDSANISKSLSERWAEVINQLEQTKYIPPNIMGTKRIKPENTSYH